MASNGDPVQVPAAIAILFSPWRRNIILAITLLAIVLGAFNIRGRLPSTRTQLRAMDVTNWLTLLANFALVISSITSIFMYSNQDVDTCFRVVLQTRVWFAIVEALLLLAMIEQMRKVTRLKMRRWRNEEYILHCLVIGGFFLGSIIFLATDDSTRQLVTSACKLAGDTRPTLFQGIFVMLVFGYFFARFLAVRLTTNDITLARWSVRHAVGALILGIYYLATSFMFVFMPRERRKNFTVVPLYLILLTSAIVTVEVLEFLLDWQPTYKALYPMSAVDSRVTFHRRPMSTGHAGLGTFSKGAIHLEAQPYSANTDGDVGTGRPRTLHSHKALDLAMSAAQISIRAINGRNRRGSSRSTHSTTEGEIEHVGYRDRNDRPRPRGNHIIDPQELEALILGESFEDFRKRSIAVAQERASLSGATRRKSSGGKKLSVVTSEATDTTASVGRSLAPPSSLQTRPKTILSFSEASDICKSYVDSDTIEMSYVSPIAQNRPESHFRHSSEQSPLPPTIPSSPLPPTPSDSNSTVPGLAEDTVQRLRSGNGDVEDDIVAPPQYRRPSVQLAATSDSSPVLPPVSTARTPEIPVITELDSAVVHVPDSPTEGLVPSPRIVPPRPQSAQPVRTTSPALFLSVPGSRQTTDLSGFGPVTMPSMTKRRASPSIAAMAVFDGEVDPHDATAQNRLSMPPSLTSLAPRTHYPPTPRSRVVSFNATTPRPTTLNEDEAKTLRDFLAAPALVLRTPTRPDTPSRPAGL
ncbi:hypothetical protein PYCC9005_000079 [Savitreella phatthalungensis]